jgi:hypothetical protein
MTLFRRQLGKLRQFFERYRLALVTSAQKFRPVEDNHRASFNLLRQELVCSGSTAPLFTWKTLPSRDQSYLDLTYVPIDIDFQ